MRTEELQRQQRLDAARLKDENSLIGRTKKIAEIVKNVIPSQPSENAELPSFFDSVENLFRLYEIGDDLKSKIMLPKLTGRARAIVNKLPLAQLDSYEAIKTALLSEFKLTPRELRSRFAQASKRCDESWALLAARLDNLLLYYLRSRKADEDIKKLIELLVADKLKDLLPASALHYVLTLEGDECFSPNKLAYSADVYTNNYNDKGIFRGSQITELSLLSGNEVRSTAKFAGPPGDTFSRAEGRTVSAGQTPAAAPTGGSGRTFNHTGRLEPGATGANANGRGRGCWTCHSPDHKQSACPGVNKAHAVNRPARANACMTRCPTAGVELANKSEVIRA